MNSCVHVYLQRDLVESTVTKVIKRCVNPNCDFKISEDETFEHNVLAMTITLEWRKGANSARRESTDGWKATLRWGDDRFCESGTVEGTIETRYFEPSPELAVAHVLQLARMFGVMGKTSRQLHSRPSLHVDGDGVDPGKTPAGWKTVLKDVADKYQLRWLYK